MLLTSVNATNVRGSVLNLPLDDPSQGFVVKEIDGLDPVKANIVSSSFAAADGDQYHSSRREARDIKFKFGLEPDYAVGSVKDLRDQLYEFFMPKSKVVLGLHLFNKFAGSALDETLDLLIDSYVETFETALFTNDPTVDISVHCPDPDFYNPIPVILNSNSINNLATNWIISYAGNVETGLLFTLRPDRSVTDFTIYFTGPDQVAQTVTFEYPLVAGDVVEISSVFGAKGVYLTRGGVKTSILYAQSPQSSWLELQPGDNNFQVYVAGAAIPFSVQYITKYGGL